MMLNSIHLLYLVSVFSINDVSIILKVKFVLPHRGEEINTAKHNIRLCGSIVLMQRSIDILFYEVLINVANTG